MVAASRTAARAAAAGAAGACAVGLLSGRAPSTFAAGPAGEPAPRAPADRAAAGPAPRAAGAAAGAAAAPAPLGLAAAGAAGATAAAALARSTRARAGQAQPRSRCSTALAAFENELGVQEPVGFWDPLGFAASGDVTAFKRRRTVELKHGRISMLATMGYITPEITGKFPGYLSNTASLKFADIPNGLAAISKVPALGWAQVVAYCGFCELSAGSDDWKNGTPGDYGFKVLTSSDPAEKEKKLAAELANGRLAMMAIIGMFFQDGLTGSAWGDWALYTASPLRAYENEPGVQPPVGFWDPLGLAASGNDFDYKRRREVELKHGRVCMFATLGYIVPEYTRLPGLLSPSYGVKFTDVPNGLGAFSKVPALGVCQIIVFAGLVEIQIYNDQVNGEPGNYGAGFLGIQSIGIMSPGWTDPEARKKKLNAELANGRLAMVAIIGMFFQDGLTGSAWGDWSLYTESPLRAFETELGVQAPLGFWDPMGFVKDGDVETFKQYREAEIKHGRVTMLATIGYMVPEYFKFQGFLSPSAGLKFADVPNGIQAITKVPGEGWLQWVALCGLYEFVVNEKVGDEPGNFGKGNLGFTGESIADPAKRTRGLNAELANGRLAMMAFWGMFFQDAFTGSAWGDWALYTDSPLRAFENELGAQAPLGFWDPLGFSSDGDVYSFKRRRSVEIKHGRICMLATMGYITPEVAGKFGGFISPSQRLAFEDIPNGLAAIGKVPGVGWLQIFAYCGWCELTYDFDEEVNTEPGNLGWKPPLLATADPEVRKRRLAAELANGRLAMMAIIGMFFQDGLTGSAWGDWAMYTASPLRAFENELGVQAPVGFWDPMGLSRDGDESAFKRRRSTEIKHGRVSMLAAMGYITPEIAGKWPGYLSYTADLKFADVPNGLAAISKVPFFGWFQILLWGGFVESGVDFGGDINATPGEVGFKPPLLASDDEAVKKRRLNAELANGRLAMMAIIGMFFQDGLTGSAWGDWSLYTESPLRAFENELGVQAPLGYWDPLGLNKSADEATFKRRRAVEIKHGRVCMLATIGYIVPYYFKWPGELSPSMGLAFEDVPQGIQAFDKLPWVGGAQIVAFCGLCETTGFFSGEARDIGFMRDSTQKGEPGNYGVGFPTFFGKVADPEVRKRKLAAELANGRLAMVAIIGMFFQDGLTGSAWGDWANYADSPIRAFESELGVQAPVGFWDPAGYTNDGSVENFKRRRATEIKHGRVSMLACMGYMTPEITGKFPGYLSPSLKLQFSDIPNGLGALSKVPGVGWAQIFAYCAYCELSQDQSAASPGGAGDFGFKAITSSDPATLTRKLNAEIANGRLAMMAIIGMFFQDGLTGSAWGDWALYADSPLRFFGGGETTSYKVFDPATELGVQEPVGFWDPLGFASDGDEATFNRRRSVELKHGRVCMAATIGYIVPEYYKFPGLLSPSEGLKFADVPNGLAALGKVPALGWVQIIFFAGIVEGAFGVTDDYRNGTPGDYGWKVITSDDPAEKEKKLSAELANGRLAMVAIIGMFFQDGLTGSAWGDWTLYTASPLRAKGGASFDPASAIGATEPLGFWDPCGFCKDKDQATFLKYRGAELKHGRVAMMSIIGFLGQPSWRFPGFEGVPDGINALGSAPAGAGFACLFLLVGFFELRILADLEEGNEPGNFGDPFKMIPTQSGGYDEYWRNFELNNGRLAMIGSIGTIAASGYTGLNAYEQWQAAKPAAIAFIKTTLPFAP